MKITLTKAEMRARLRLLAGLEPLHSDCSVEYTDGLDLDGLLDQKLRAWYLNLLDHGDISLLAPTDMAAATRCEEGPAGGCSIALPAMCRRVGSVRLEGWARPVEVLPAGEAAAILRRQLNPFLAATANSPVAVVAPGSNGGAIGTVLAWPGAGSVESLTVVLDSGPDSYTLDETALGMLEEIAGKMDIL